VIITIECEYGMVDDIEDIQPIIRVQMVMVMICDHVCQCMVCTTSSNTIPAKQMTAINRKHNISLFSRVLSMY
jgi:hypothetical protein